MVFQQPYWFLGIFPLLLYFGLALRSRFDLQRRRQALFFADRQMRRSLLSLLFLCGAGALLLAALAEPVIYRMQPVFKRSGINIVVGIDISKSMLAEDA
ncbi:MAG: hypothetical protein J7M09_05110, partial [Deltaproteobacteria bacterium]|nr:hypothetical protein [Candidatus Tharpella sp.]